MLFFLVTHWPKKQQQKNKHRRDRLSLSPSTLLFIRSTHFKVLQRLYLFLLLLPLAMLISFLCIHLTLASKKAFSLQSTLYSLVMKQSLLSFLPCLFPPQQFPWKKAVFKLLLFIRATRPASLLCGQRRQHTASLSSHERRCQESLLSAKLYLRDFSEPQA